MSRILACFDFDGTITNKDSLLEFIKYSKGSASFYLGFALNLPVLVAYKLKVITNQRAKEIMLRYFFGRMKLAQFETYCERFSTEIVPALIRPKALKEIKKLIELDAEVVIVSASPENWLKRWCLANGAKCIATKLVVHDEAITGKIKGFNCHGEEKVRRILEHYDLRNFSAVYCYGDTPGDKPMLALGSRRFYKPFR